MGSDTIKGLVCNNRVMDFRTIFLIIKSIVLNIQTLLIPVKIHNEGGNLPGLNGLHRGQAASVYSILSYKWINIE